MKLKKLLLVLVWRGIMNWNLNKKIIMAFAAVIAIVVVMSAFTYYEVGQLNQMHIQAARSHMEKMSLAQGISADIANEAVAMRRFNFTGDANDITVFNTYRKQSDDKLKQLESILSVEKNKIVVEKIHQGKTEYESIAEKSFLAKKDNNINEVSRYMSEAGRPYKASMEASLQMINNVDDFVKADEQLTNDQVVSIQRILLIVNVFVALIALGIGQYLSRKISRPAQAVSRAAASIAAGDLSQPDVLVDTNDEIAEMGHSFNAMKKKLSETMRTVAISAEQVAASSEELTSSAEQSARASEQGAQAISAVAESATHQLKSMDHTSAVVQTLSAGLEEAAASVNEVTEQASQASQAAVDGVQAVMKAVKQMQNIEETVTFSSKVVSKLGESSKEIGQIIETISGIAAQTNLLALNAAIEAARAGEQGRGFTVVAEEVRKLAEQSQRAAKQITILVDGIQMDTADAVTAMANGTKEVAIGVDVVQVTGTTFENIKGIVFRVANQMKEMSTVIDHMADGSQQIVLAVGAIDSKSKVVAAESEHVAAVTEEQSASAQEIAASSHALSEMAQEMQKAVSQFRF